MRRGDRAVWAYATLVVLAACGSNTLHPADGAAGAASGGGGDSAGVSGGAGVTGGAGTNPGPDCPLHVPKAQETCGPSRRCAYYEPGFHPPCATVASCDLTWIVERPAPTCGARSSQCPSSYTSLAIGAPCPIPDGECSYDEGRCACTPCRGSGDAVGSQWSCRKWGSGGDGCPALAPPESTRCEPPGLFCTYGSFCTVAVGDNLQCMDDEWRKMPSPPGLCALPACGP